MARASELVLNEDNSVYHLNLKQGEIADKVITVGDPDRVDKIIERFDSIELRRRNREFYTVTGIFNNSHLSVISTGIGPDNIDIVFNELDILKRYDLPSGKKREINQPYTFLRLGTTGTSQKEIDVGSFIASEYAIGMDNLLHYYEYEEPDVEFATALKTYLEGFLYEGFNPLITKGNTSLLSSLNHNFKRGITVTCPGFYAPQGRSVSLRARLDNFPEILSGFEYKNYRITNFEMETNAIYGLSSLLGHRALSCSVVLANRMTGDFSETPQKSIEKLIEEGLAFIESV